MSLVINTNSIATVTRNYLNSNQANLKTSLSRLASGSRIVNPSDDAGGLAVGNKLAATLNRNTRAQQNVQNSISFLQVQDGALTQVGKILDRMSELKTMSLDVTKNASDIANYDAEFNQLQDQLSNIKEEKFNGISLFTSGASGPSSLTTYTTETGDGVVSTSALQVLMSSISPLMTLEVHRLHIQPMPQQLRAYSLPRFRQTMQV
jgi:flagellin